MSHEKIRHTPSAEKNPLKERKMNGYEVGNFLAAIGNHEGQALLLASMREGLYLRSDLARLILEPQKRARMVWNLDSKVLWRWCESSFAPMGLVVSEEDIRGSHGYMRTKDQGAKAVGLAGHLLEFSERHSELSLQSLLGSAKSTAQSQKIITSSGEEREFRIRSPLTRYRIFSALVACELPIRNTDLQQILQHISPREYPRDKENLLGIHLASLAKDNIIGYELPQISFELAPNRPEEEPTSYQQHVKLTKYTYAILQENPTQKLSNQEIYEILCREKPEYARLSERNVRSNLSGIVNHLVREGYVAKGESSGSKRSKITLSDTQKATLREFVEIVDKFASLDETFLAEGKKKAEAIVSDPERFCTLLEKARENSSNANKVARRETEAKILAFLSEQPNSTGKDVQNYLAENGHKVGQKYVGELLKTLQKKGVLEITQKKKVNVYSVLKREETDE